jgi:hypothetical protein
VHKMFFFFLNEITVAQVMNANILSFFMPSKDLEGGNINYDNPICKIQT